MDIRTRREKITFRRPFLLQVIGRSLPAGTYEVITDEELIEGLSFPVYRRVSTMVFAPATPPSSAIEMLTVDPHELAAALERDTSSDVDATVAPKVR
jgi:hypothetical protein